MICSRCLKEIPEHSKFCRECGERQTPLCPQCGGRVSPVSHSCSKCGYHAYPADQREGHPAASYGEKRHVTVLFSDLTGYTALMQRLDPEEVKEIMARIFMEISKAVNKYEGFIEKYVGDAIMALFGADRSHEDDPIRAIRAALEIHKRMETINLLFAKVTGSPLKMHTGINTGVVVTGEMSADTRTRGALGDTINLASRLMVAAGPGEIVVSPDTYHRAKGHFQFETGEALPLKGKDKAVQTYKVLSNPAEPYRIRRLSGMRADMIGREKELAVLSGALRELKAGHGSIVAVAGNAGTGKSRLMEEFKGLIDMNEIQWREGHAYEYSQDIPYSPLIDMLRRTLLIQEDYTPEQIRNRLEPRYRFLLGDRKDLMPYIGSIFSLSYSETEGITPDMWKARLHEAIQVLMDNLSHTLPTVAYFEDLQWADPSFTALLKTVLTDFEYPILFIFTYRPPFSIFDSNQPVLNRPFTEIMLHDLSPAESEKMTESFLGTEKLPAELRRYIGDKAEGNPFYIEETLRSLVETKVLINEDGNWTLSKPLETVPMPGTVQGVIMARVDRLDGNHKRVLREASVIGREFQFQILKGITAAGENIHAIVAYLERMDLIRRIASAPQLTYAFKHVLTREAIYNGLVRKERREIHENAGLVMEKLLQKRLPEYYERLSFHFSQGHSTGKAVFYLRKAGEKNMGRYSLQEADHYYREAFELLHGTPNKSREDELLLVDILLDWTLVYYHQAAYADMYELLMKHEPLILSLSDKARTGMFFIQTGSALSRLERNREACQQLRNALAIGEELGDSRIIAYAGTWLITNYADLGLLDEAVKTGKRVREMEQYASDEYVFRLATASLGYAHYFAGDAGTVLEAGKLLIEYGSGHDDRASLSLGHTCLGISRVLRGDFASATDCFRESMRISSEPLYVYATKIMLGMTYAATGQLTEAEDVLDDIIRFSGRTGYNLVGTMASGLSGIVMLARGNLQRGIDTVNGAINLCARNNSRWRHASLNLMLGRFYLQIARGGAGRSLSFLLKNIIFLVKTVPFAGEKAEHHLTLAADTAREIGAKAVLAQASLELCRLYKLRKKDALADSCIREAVQLFEQCEADILLRQARELMASPR